MALPETETEGAGVGAVSPDDSARPAGVALVAGLAVDFGVLVVPGFGVPVPGEAPAEGVAGAVGNALGGVMTAGATAST
ncbi:hypothetical protein GCM10007964_32110 [Sphaerisporangium melleum]|uniref:Uncharacterized protein n=1 Tax=Sphaerisporangium melleum TaxID=321316 RepID=A0A917R3N7_9ACTN|nr:hypothetical protein GCM10007964_32110 [Sphaerisporangium melleum]